MILPRNIKKAKAQGPKRSPIVFETPSPASANAEAHWLMESSLAPAHIITTPNIQKSGVFIISVTEPRSRPTTGLLSHFKDIWIGVDVFNLLDISNVSSYYWVTDVNQIQYAVPNYLTRRQFNVRLSLRF